MVDRIEGVVRVELVNRIRRVAGIVLIDGIKRILRIVGIDWIQRIVRTVLVDRIEDIVVALIFLRETGFGKRRSGEEEATEEPDHPHGEPPKSETTSRLSLLPAEPQYKTGNTSSRSTFLQAVMVGLIEPGNKPLQPLPRYPAGSIFGVPHLTHLFELQK